MMVVSTAFAAETEYQVYVGTYTGPQSKGIYAFRFTPSNGEFTAPQLAGETENPSFLEADTRGRYLYAVNELENYKGAASGAVSAFSIDPATAKLKFEQQVSSLGAAPAYLTLDKTGRNLLVANYNGGNVVVFPIGKDGKLADHSALQQHAGSSVDPDRQKAPHAHSVQMTNDNRFAMSADLGMDKIVIYRFDPAHGTLTPNDPKFTAVKPGSGPRHLAFGPSGKFIYVINEMGTTVSVFSYDAKTASMHEVQTIPTVEKHNPANTAAEILLDAKGRFLYTSTRGEDTLAQFSVDQNTGKLTLIDRLPAGGKGPRYMTLDPTGRWLFVANQYSNDIILFRVDPSTGKLTPTGKRIELSAPVCLSFVRAEEHKK